VGAGTRVTPQGSSRDGSGTLVGALVIGVALCSPSRAETKLTFDASVGIGGVAAATNDGRTDTRGGLQAALGIGARFDRLEVGARANAFRWQVPDTHHGGDVTVLGVDVTQIYLGPGLRYHARPRLWIGGGLGLLQIAHRTRDGLQSTYHERHLALDLRLGFVIVQTARHVFELSTEVVAYHDRTDPRPGNDVTPQLGMLAGYRFD
jgi:hypothetical protein